MKIKKENVIECYKVFNSDWTCRGFQYEVGKEYKCTGEIKPCEKGFHCCSKLVSCFNYYDFDPRNKVAQVEIWGDVKRKEDKLCASNIKIIKELNWHTVLELANIGEDNTGMCNTGNWNSGNFNSGDRNFGYRNSGHWNSGSYNSGSYNSGDRNSGDRNSGDFNSGDFNSGYRNSGDFNSGYRNSGNFNSGNFNSGNFNSGNFNSGNWNSGSRNLGYFNTPEQNQIFCFNKPTQNKDIEFPDFLYFNLTEWVHTKDMTDEEKEQHPKYLTTGGFLRHLKYKKAFRKSFESAKKESNWKQQLSLLKAIPNFDADIFYEISGIKPEELK